MNYTERAVAFACGQETLRGILAVPQGVNASVGVVVIVGGPQYRAGSHRQFVLLSRALAAARYPVMRFDYRGMGDSTGKQRDFSDVSLDVAAAIDALQSALPAIQKVALWGLCDGASAALLYCHETRDKRVRGLCLLNPWVRSEASLARAHVKHYYADRLRQKEFWIKLVSGKVAGAALAALWGNLMLAVRRSDQSKISAVTPFQNRMALAWRNFGGGILLLLSDEDYTAKEFLEYVNSADSWKGLLQCAAVVRHDLHGADHTLSQNSSRMNVEVLTSQWLKALEQNNECANGR
jgi:exosortase A-associated hydrolase 1